MKEHKVVLTVVECRWCGRHIKLNPKTNEPIEHEYGPVEGSHVKWKACTKPKGA